MKNTNKEYFVYGLVVPFDWYKEWETMTGKDFFLTFSSFINTNENRNNIFSVFKGRDGKFMIIGKIIGIVSKDNCIQIPTLTETEKQLVCDIIEDHFGGKLTGEYNYYYVKN